ncbi:MAG: hypothetical protein FJ144_17180 [Deltaproteobacteria bacterium]|nr:hypothetical protein [Deltaproteobacteria bacterium]
MASENGRLIPLVAPYGDEITVYVKGFLAPGESPEHFDNWRAAHERLVESHGWGPGAVGWAWSAGTRPALPLPLASGAKLAWDVYRAVRHARVAALGMTVGLAVAEIGARYAAQYVLAAQRARTEARALAGALEDLAVRHARVRVVAHSLGCRQVVEAMRWLPPEKRPHEIHLCAAAVVEEEVCEHLDDLAREKTYLYFSSNDFVLGLAFPLFAWDRALGSVRPAGEYAGLEVIDVSRHFGFRVHAEYKHRFAEFAARHAELAAASPASLAAEAILPAQTLAPSSPAEPLERSAELA